MDAQSWTRWLAGRRRGSWLLLIALSGCTPAGDAGTGDDLAGLADAAASTDGATPTDLAVCGDGRCSAEPTIVSDTFPAKALPLGATAVDVSVTFSEVVRGVALDSTITAAGGAVLSNLASSDGVTWSFHVAGVANHQSYTITFAAGITDGAGLAFAGTTRTIKGGDTIIVPPAPGGGAMFGGAREGMILMADGTVWDWGADFHGHLGDGSLMDTDEYVPVQVVGPLGVGHLGSIVAIASGEPFNVALRSDGTVWTWGDNSVAGELGVGPVKPPVDSHVPVQVHGPGDVGFLGSIIGIGSRGYHALALASDTTVWAWGFNNFGQLGAGNPGVNSSLPVHVQGPGGAGFLGDVAAVTSGYSHSLALKSDHTVWGWGGNGTGQLGNGNLMASPAPIQIDARDLHDITQLSAGWKHSLALRSDHTVWAWGDGTLGAVGNGCKEGVDCGAVTTPVQVPITDVIAVSGGDCHSAALKSDGTVWTWGCNHHGGTNPAMDPVGQLGNGDQTYTDVSVPTQVHGPDNKGFLTSITVISARDYHNYALDSNGTLWSWGSNLNGQLGTGACCTPSTFPVKVKLP